jgi:hypothetical protein
VLDAAVQYVFSTGLGKSTTRYKAQELSLQGIEASSTCRMQIFFPWEVSKPFTGAPHIKHERIVHELLQQDKHCTGCAKDLRLIGEEAASAMSTFQHPSW